MTFREQYRAALTVKSAASPETTPDAAYFAGTFYELSETAADRLPAVLSGDRIEIGETLALSFRPLDCRMLFYIQEGSGTFRLSSGKAHALFPDMLLYLDCSRQPFSLTSDQCPLRMIAFSLGGGFLAFMSLWFPSIPFCSPGSTGFLRSGEIWSSFSPAAPARRWKINFGIPA